jgi:hypothetical protein
MRKTLAVEVSASRLIRLFHWDDLYTILSRKWDFACCFCCWSLKAYCSALSAIVTMSQNCNKILHSPDKGNRTEWMKEVNPWKKFPFLFFFTREKSFFFYLILFLATQCNILHTLVRSTMNWSEEIFCESILCWITKFHYVWWACAGISMQSLCTWYTWRNLLTFKCIYFSISAIQWSVQIWYLQDSSYSFILFMLSSTTEIR